MKVSELAAIVAAQAEELASLRKEIEALKATRTVATISAPAERKSSGRKPVGFAIYVGEEVRERFDSAAEANARIRELKIPGSRTGAIYE